MDCLNKTPTETIRISSSIKEHHGHLQLACDRQREPPLGPPRPHGIPSRADPEHGGLCRRRGSPDRSPDAGATPRRVGVRARCHGRHGAFDRESGGLASLPFAAVLLRGESATSSQIENLTVRARKLSLAAVGARIGGNAELVARTVKAMRAAIAAASHLDFDAASRHRCARSPTCAAPNPRSRREW